MERVLEKMAIPVSQLDPTEIASFIGEEKTTVKTADADCKDAKRRVSQAKGPRAKRRKTEQAEAEQSDSDVPDEIPDL